MSKHRVKTAVKLIAIAAVLVCIPYILARQTHVHERSHVNVDSHPAPQNIKSKLSQKADYIPKTEYLLDQLTAVAQHYGIAMGIEWELKAWQEAGVEFPVSGNNLTVQDLLQTIVSKMPGYQMTVENEIIHIAPSTLSADSNNFLNVRIEEFSVENENLFQAEEELRSTIDSTLHPEDYEGGYAGGYGYGSDDVLAKRIITFKGENLTVREILDGLARKSGNALWIALLGTNNSLGAGSAGADNQEGPKSKYRFKFVPLTEKPNT
ncbi:MAG: hypothetical protein WKF74_02765 [Pyrinomonadaceae bacterium]